MRIMGLMLRALAETLEQGVSQILESQQEPAGDQVEAVRHDSEGASEAPPSEDDNSGAAAPSPPRPVVVDAVFADRPPPEPDESEGPADSDAAMVPDAAGEESSGGHSDQRQSESRVIEPDSIPLPADTDEDSDSTHQARSQSEAVTSSRDSDEISSTDQHSPPAPAEPSGQESDEKRAILDLLRSSERDLRGYEIAEATGISPWWRLKEILADLQAQNLIVQPQEGLFQIAPESNP